MIFAHSVKWIPQQKHNSPLLGHHRILRNSEHVWISKRAQVPYPLFHVVRSPCDVIWGVQSLLFLHPGGKTVSEASWIHLIMIELSTAEAGVSGLMQWCEDVGSSA